MTNTRTLTPVELDDLDAIHGGKGFWNGLGQLAQNMMGFAPQPAGMSSATTALQFAPGLTGVAAQAQAKNNLITELAKPNGGGPGVDAAFNQYNNGPGARFLRGQYK